MIVLEKYSKIIKNNNTRRNTTSICPHRQDYLNTKPLAGKLDNDFTAIACMQDGVDYHKDKISRATRI